RVRGRRLAGGLSPESAEDALAVGAHRRLAVAVLRGTLPAARRSVRLVVRLERPRARATAGARWLGRGMGWAARTGGSPTTGRRRRVRAPVQHVDRARVHRPRG